MAQKIKGITIEIGGDTSKLGKSLEGVNSKTKDLQKELRGVNTLLKMDPTNVNLIKQKQDLLNKSIETTKEKLTTLKNAQLQVQNQFDKGQITSEQYRDFQREIVATENKLNSLTKQAKAFGDNMSANLISASGKIEEFGNKTQNVGKKMLGATAAITAGTIAVATTAVKSMNDVDDGLDTVMKKTGATGESAKDLQNIFTNVAEQIPAEFSEVGAAVGEINTRLDLTGDELEKASIAFLKFAKVNDADVNQAVQLVTRAMGDAGIEASNYQEILDMITVAAQKSGVSIESLTTNLAKYGAPMRALGVDTEQAIAMFSAWEKAGVNTEIAFSGMKKAISNWGASGKDSRVEFQKTLDEIKKCPDIASATTKAIEVFGTKAGPDLADAIQGGRFEFETYVNALESSTGTIDDTYKMIVDEVDDAQLASQTFKISLHSLGETISKTIGPILLKLANKFKSLMERFSKLSPTVQKIVLIIIALVAAIGPLLIVIGKIATGISAMIKVFGAISRIISIVKGAFMAFNAVLLANPIVLIVAAIAALIAGFVLLWTKCEWFRNFWIDLWESVKKICKSVIDGIVGLFTGIIDFIKNNWKSLLLFIVNPFAGAFKLLYDNCDGFRNFIDGLIQKIKDIFSSIVSFIKNSIIEPIKKFFTPLIEWFSNLFISIYNTLASIINVIWGIIRGLWDMIVALFTTIASWINENVIMPVINIIVSAFEFVKNGFIAAWEFIKGIFITVATWIQENVMTPIINLFMTIWTWIQENIITPLQTVFTNVWNTLVNGATSAWEGVKNVFSTVASFFGNIFSTAWQKVKDVFSTGGKIFEGIKDSIASVFTTVVNKIIGGINTVIAIPFNAINATLNKIRNIHFLKISPFKDKWGENPLAVPEIPLLRTGASMIGNGQAIMAEAGSPELITMMNGKAIVRPLTSTDRKQVVNNSGSDSFTVNINNNSRYTSPAENERLFSNALLRYKLRKG